MLKYGKLALYDGLSGTSGQVASPYEPADLPSDKAEAGTRTLPAPTTTDRAPARRRRAEADVVMKGPATRR
jgi:hypothetical protein